MLEQIIKNSSIKSIRGKIILAVMLFCANAAFALEISVDSQKYPVEVYGDYLEYRTKSGQVITKGKSFISYQDMKISGDNIQANTNTEDIFAQGTVDFWKGYDEVRGDFIVYNMKTGKGWMRNAEVYKGRNFFKAKDAYISPAHQLLHEVMHTTCDEVEHPHYRLEAKTIDTYPGHSMTMEGLKAKWKGKTIFYQKLNRSNARQKGNKFFSTRQGSSDIDGYYVKLTSDLYVNQHLQGKLNYDWFEKRGYAYGFNGTYDISGDNGNGSIYYYNLRETKRGHYNTQVNFSYNLTFKSGESLSTTINYTGDKYDGQAENQDMTVTATFRPVLKFMNMTINMNKFYDLDKDKYDLDKAYQFVNRLPEINFSFPAWTMPVVPITINFNGMYGHYEESDGEGKKDTEKKDGRLSFSCPAVEVNERFQFTPSYNFEKSWYTGDIERENGNTMLRATHKFSNVTNLEFNYNVSTSKGKSPFKFDNTTTIDQTSTRLRFSENSWTLNPLNFNYNRTTRRLEQVYWDYSRRSRQDAYRTWEFFCRQDFLCDADTPLSKMNFGAIKANSFNARYRMSTENWSFDTSVTIPQEYKKITTTSFNYSTVIRPLWTIDTSGTYNNLTHKMSPLTIGFTRDLHCWEARAEYNHERKEFWMEFYLKAFPNDSGRFNYGTDDNKLSAKLAAYDQIANRYDNY